MIQNAVIDADKLTQEVINKVVSATATGVTSTSIDNLMITLSNVPVKVSQGGYVHLILSANISGSPGTLLGGVSKLHRSEEHTSELQSLMRISYAVFCLKKKISKPTYTCSIPHAQIRQ